MKKRNVAAMMLAAAMMGTLLAGCGNSQKTAETTVSKPEASAESKAEDGTSADSSVSDSKWPNGNVTIYIPAKAGGGSDMIARLFTQAMSETTGKSFVVVNDETGAGSVAAEKIRNEKPDGLNLYMPHTGFCGTISAGQYNHSFDDFTIIAMTTTEGTEGNGIFVNADSQFQTFDDFIAYAKEHPGELTGGVEANKSGHNALLLLQNEIGFESTIVDSGSSADRITSLMGGMIDFSTLPTATAAQYVESGDLRCLVTLGALKSEAIKDVPTIEECGYSTCDLPTCMILLGPAGMSDADVAKIHEYLKIASENTTLKEGLAKLGTDWKYMTQEESIQYVHDMQERYDTAFSLQNR